MSFRRSLVYVLRRLGREFVILAVVGVVLYFLLDLAMMMRLERVVAAYNVQAAANAPILEARTTPHPPWPIPKELTDALPETWDAFAGTPEGGAILFQLDSIKRDWIWNILDMNRPNTVGPAPRRYSPAEQVYFNTLFQRMTPVLETLAATPLPGEDGPRTLPRGAINLQEPFDYLGLAAGRLVMVADFDRATTLLTITGRAWQAVWRGEPMLDIQRKNYLATYLASLEVLLLHHTPEPEEIDALLRIVADIRHRFVDARLARVPGSAVDRALYLERRPRYRRIYDAYGIANFLIAKQELGKALLIPDYPTRTRAYAQAYTDYGERGTRQRYAIPEQVDDMNQIEVLTAECEVIALMLTLEKHRNAHGTYPESLDTLDDFPPPGIDAAVYTDHPIRYRPWEAGQHYGLSRDMYHLRGAALVRTWRTRASEESPGAH